MRGVLSSRNSAAVAVCGEYAAGSARRVHDRRVLLVTP
jgi:hypothetical protein